MHLLAESNFYKIERPAESEEGSSESGKPEKKVLAVLEVTGGELGFDPGNIDGLAGISATPLDSSEVRGLVVNLVPQVQVSYSTSYIFNEELFTLLYNGAAILQSAKGRNKKSASNIPLHNASITLATDNVRNAPYMQQLQKSLRNLGSYGVAYLMTEFNHGDDGRVHILFEMWVPENKKNQVLKLLVEYNFEMTEMTQEEIRLRQVPASSGASRMLETASGEGTSTNTATIINPELARRAIEEAAGNSLAVLGAVSQVVKKKP